MQLGSVYLNAPSALLIVLQYFLLSLRKNIFNKYFHFFFYNIN